MTNDTQSPRSEMRWSTPLPAGAPRADTTLNRFLGGSPAAVFVRLVFVSLIVGALLMWLDIRPWEIFRAIERLATRLWSLGFEAIHEIAAYVIAGAVIVVPVWLILRLLNFRGGR